MNTPLSKRTAPAIGLVAALLACGVSHAQTVHKCQVDGRLVFQSSPCPQDARVAAVTAPLAAAEPVVPPKKKTLAELLRERDGAEKARSPTREVQGDGANVLRSRMGAV